MNDKGLTRSITVQGSQRALSYSSFTDLETWASAKRGSKVEESDWSDLFFAWIEQGQVGCTFATKLASDPKAAQWEAYVVGDSEDLAEKLTVTIDAANDRGLEAVHFLFPGVVTAGQITDLLNALTLHERWSCHRVILAEEDFSEKMAACKACQGNFETHQNVATDLNIGLRFKLKSGQMAWTLGIAPYSTMPTTRRFEDAPFSAIFVRSGESMQGHEENIPVHLCDMRSPELGISKETESVSWERRFDASKKLRRVVLSESPICKARASVTFCLPATEEGKLSLSEPEIHGGQVKQ